MDQLIARMANNLLNLALDCIHSVGEVEYYFCPLLVNISILAISDELRVGVDIEKTLIL